MDAEQFKRAGYDLVQIAYDYMATLHKREPLPNVKPGYLKAIVPPDPPEHPESWDAIKKDIEEVALKGMSHWQHRHFHAYFPAGNSWPSILGDLLSNATGSIGSTWESCPAATELEMIVMDWICKFLALPDFFLSPFSNPKSQGGGVIQTSASDAILLSMIAAREQGIKKLRQQYPDKPRAVLLKKMVGYCSDQCHSSVEKAAMIAYVHLRQCPPDDTGSVRATTLRAMIKEDKAKGLIPFYHCAILGSTGICAFDDLEELGPVVEENGMWLHVDGAYAGSSFSCPELRYLSSGMRYAWSFNCNTNKWMLTNFDASCHWVRYKDKYCGAFSGFDNEIFKGPITDYRFWGIPHERRFRAIKLFCVIKNYGVKGLRAYCRRHIYLAKLFERHVNRDSRFEVVGPVRVGLVCFRLLGTNDLNKRLLEAMNTSRRIHMVPSYFKDKYVIRFALCAEHADENDVDFAWKVTEEYATVVIHLYQQEMSDKEALQPLFDKQEEFEKEHKLPAEEKELETEVSMLIQRRGSAEEDEIIKATSYLDGSYSAGDEKGMEEYDNIILSTPDSLKEKEEIWPSKGRAKRRSGAFVDDPSFTSTDN